MSKKLRGELEAFVKAVTGPSLSEVVDLGELTMEDFEEKHSHVDPYDTFCKTLSNCIKLIVSKAGEDPRQRYMDKETKIWGEKVKETFDKCGRKMSNYVERNDSHPSKKDSDKATWANVKNAWGMLLKDRATTKFINYLVDIGKIKDKNKFMRLINADELFNEKNATKHTDGVGGGLAPNHLKTVLNLHKKCTKYKEFIEEVPRFISCMGYIWGKDVWITIPKDVIDAWGYLDLTIKALEKNPTQHTREELKRAIKQHDRSDKWSTFVDLQDRVTHLMADINSSRITKIWGIGGIGKTALTIACLKELTNDKLWSEHEFYRFTVKSKEQGEYTGTGLSKAINYSILQYGLSIQKIITDIARKSEKYEEGLIMDQQIEYAIDYLQKNPCIIIIDNAEDIEDTKNSDYKLFNAFIDGFSGLTIDSKSKLIINSRNPKDYPGVNTVKAKYLNSEEMKELAESRNKHLLKSTGEEVVMRWNIVDDNEFGDWNIISDWAKSKLGGREKDAVGHPHFIIIAVYEWTCNKEKIPFSEHLKKLVKSEKIKDLEKYITSKSIDLLDPDLNEWTYQLAAQFHKDFDKEDIRSILPEEGKGLCEDIIQHLNIHLGLIKEIWMENKKAYEWVEYARKEFAAKYHGQQIKPKKAKKLEFEEYKSHSIDSVAKQIEQYDSSDDVPLNKIIEKGEAFIADDTTLKTERTISQAIRVDHHLKSILSENKSFISIEQRKQLTNISTKAKIKSTDGLRTIITKDINDERIGQRIEKCIAYCLHIANTNWSEEIDAFDSHLNFIIDKFDNFNRGNIHQILEDIIVKSWAMKTRSNNALILLGMKFHKYLRISTKLLIHAAIADEENCIINGEIRQFMFLHFAKDIDCYTREISRSRSRPRRKYAEILKLLETHNESENDYEELSTLEKYFSEDDNKCSVLNVLVKLEGGVRFCKAVDKQNGIRMILHNAPSNFKKNGTSEPIILTTQHLTTKKYEEFVGIHLRYIAINHKLTPRGFDKDKVRADFEPIREQPVEEIYREILDGALSTSFQATWPLGEEVNKKCIERLGISSRQVRKKLGNKHKRFHKSLLEIYANQIEIESDGAGANSNFMVKLRY
jgi:hypothetical protein